MNIAPVIAADVGTLIGVAFTVITFITWIINLMNAQQKPARNGRANRPARPRSERIQSEIEQFIREQAGQKPATTPTAPQRPQPVKTAPRRVTRTPVAKSAPRPVPAPPPPAPTRLGSTIADRRLGTPTTSNQSLSGNIRTTLSERHRIGSQTLPHSVDASVSQHLGAFGTTQSGSNADSATLTSQEVFQQLRTGDGIRRALILSEILRPPVARRR